jgi:hypothetical protein
MESHLARLAPRTSQGLALPEASSGPQDALITVVCLWRAHAVCTETDTICNANNVVT